LVTATVLILTAGRSSFLDRTFAGLRSQVFKDFEVLLVLKKIDPATVAIVEKFKKFLNIRIIAQKFRSFMAAYNEGISNAVGSIIVFLDDDAVPEPMWLSEHVSSYDLPEISGVSGEVVSARLDKDNIIQIEGSSEIAQFYAESKLLKAFGAKFWNRPLESQENYLAYISKAGYSQKALYPVYGEKTNSLLCMASNMSVRKVALQDFEIPTSFIKRGIAFEQIVGWFLLKAGHRTIFNPCAKVYHIIHGMTKSRFLDADAISQAYVEDELLFYYLFFKEENLSIMHRIISLAHRLFVHLRKFEGNWKRERYVLKGIFVGNLLGVAWLISRKVQGSFIPAQSALFQ